MYAHFSNWIQWAEYDKEMRAFEAGSIGEKGVETRTLDMYEREVGLFGAWMQRRGHVKAVEWQQEDGGWRLQPMVSEGAMVVPSVSSIIEYVLKMATGDASCPKGGTPEYRNGEWYLKFGGKEQGELMTVANAQAYGAERFLWRQVPILAQE